MGTTIERFEGRFATLTGSEKQIAWATTIRQQLAEGAAQVIDRSLAAGKLDEAERAAANADRATWHEASAGWWIDMRSHVARISDRFRNPANLLFTEEQFTA